MNPVAWFVPGVRANGATFFAGLIVWLLIDAARTAGLLYGGVDLPAMTGLISLVLIVLFLIFLHVNRLNDAGRSWTWVLLPVLLSIVAYFVVLMIFGMMIFFEQLGVYADANGLDGGTIMQDPALMAEFQAWFEANADQWAGSQGVATWSSFAAFWIVYVLFGFWFRGMPSREAA